MPTFKTLMYSRHVLALGVRASKRICGVECVIAIFSSFCALQTKIAIGDKLGCITIWLIWHVPGFKDGLLRCQTISITYDTQYGTQNSNVDGLSRLPLATKTLKAGREKTVGPDLETRMYRFLSRYRVTPPPKK